jgi:RimJ/RimL family protein N-acetyltransferase/nitroimidazol reductase NimA-like FMN-containing flavoprotein (pyridoxamine 5'-phosphate oxidase superfamily)
VIPRTPPRQADDVVVGSGDGVDRHTTTVRPIEPGDADRLVAFHGQLSPETTYYRFFNPHPRLTATELERFTQVDHHGREALVVLEDDEIVAVARFERGPDGRAEVAFVVRDDHQGQGLGAVLFDLLAERAREEGIHELVAETLPQNRRMLAVFRHAGLPEQVQYGDGVVHVSLGLDDPTEDQVTARSTRFLDRDECLERLAHARLGRAAVTVNGVPHVVPVNYALLDGAIVFRSGAGTKFHAALLSEPMSFEVDHFDPDAATGWSVLVSGRSHLVVDPGELARVDAMGLEALDPGGKHAVVRVGADLVSGRAIG